MRLDQATALTVRALEWRSFWWRRRCEECGQKSRGPFVLVRAWWDACTRRNFRKSCLPSCLEHPPAQVCMTCWGGVPGIVVRAGVAPHEVLRGVPYASLKWEDVGVFDGVAKAHWRDVYAAMEGNDRLESAAGVEEGEDQIRDVQVRPNE